jgi:hypothetical protein
VRGVWGLTVLALTGCGSSDRPGLVGGATPVYNKETGALEQLLSDSDGDGKVDTRAFMDGVRLKHIEIDRNADGAPDRWEFYLPAAGATAAGAPAAQTLLSHVEEAGAFDKRITRREFYQQGILSRVEEDTDLDGRPDKWEFYEAGTLARIDLDLLGKGAATRRLFYGAGGAVTRVEADPEGDGTFVPVPAAAPIVKQNGG